MPTETRSRRTSCSNTAEKPTKKQAQQQGALEKQGLLQLNKERKKDFKKMLKNRKRAGQYCFCNIIYFFHIERIIFNLICLSICFKYLVFYKSNYNWFYLNEWIFF